MNDCILSNGWESLWWWAARSYSPNHAAIHMALETGEALRG